MKTDWQIEWCDNEPHAKIVKLVSQDKTITLRYAWKDDDSNVKEVFTEATKTARDLQRLLNFGLTKSTDLVVKELIAQESVSLVPEAKKRSKWWNWLAWTGIALAVWHLVVIMFGYHSIFESLKQ